MSNNKCIMCEKEGIDIKKCVCEFSFCGICAKEELHENKSKHCVECNENVCTSYFSINKLKGLEICDNCDIKNKFERLKKYKMN